LHDRRTLLSRNGVRVICYRHEVIKRGRETNYPVVVDCG
jgi:hypothetical protein